MKSLMILNDRDIRKYLEHRIQPFKEENLQPNSYDLTLGRNFLSPNKDCWFDLSENNSDKYTELKDLDKIVLRPYEFILATTEEYIELPLGISATVWGRSSVGRTGLFIHNAGLIDAGFNGQITLELFNASRHNIIIPTGMRIAQLQFEHLTNVPEQIYNGKYQNQQDVTGSKIHMDFSQCRKVEGSEEDLSDNPYVDDSGLMLGDIY